MQDLDAESLRLLMGSLPAWVKFEDFERARFVNQTLRGMWPYLDTTICSAIKQFVEPLVQNHLPSAVSGFMFEKLSFGNSPFEVRGVKHASLFAGPGEAMALTLDVDAAWVAAPDIVAKLMPAAKWRFSHMDLRPAMWVKADYMHVEGRLRLSFPLQATLPIFSGMSICFLEAPRIDLSLKMLGGVDIMSMPALREWFAQLIAEQISAAMTFPRRVDVSFTGGDAAEHARRGCWPQGVVTARLSRVAMPHWQRQACVPAMVLKPAAWLDPRLECDVHAMTYPLVLDPQNPSTLETWQAAFPVFDAAQALKLVMLENVKGGRGCPTASVKLPLGPLLCQGAPEALRAEWPVATARRRSGHALSAGVGKLHGWLTKRGSEGVLTVPPALTPRVRKRDRALMAMHRRLSMHTGMKRAISDSHLPRLHGRLPGPARSLGSSHHGSGGAPTFGARCSDDLVDLFGRRSGGAAAPDAGDSTTVISPDPQAMGAAPAATPAACSPHTAEGSEPSQRHRFFKRLVRFGRHQAPQLEASPAPPPPPAPAPVPAVGGSSHHVHIPRPHNKPPKQALPSRQHHLHLPHFFHRHEHAARVPNAVGVRGSDGHAWPLTEVREVAAAAPAAPQGTQLLEAAAAQTLRPQAAAAPLPSVTHQWHDSEHLDDLFGPWADANPPPPHGAVSAAPRDHAPLDAEPGARHAETRRTWHGSMPPAGPQPPFPPDAPPRHPAPLATLLLPLADTHTRDAARPSGSPEGATQSENTPARASPAPRSLASSPLSRGTRSGGTQQPGAATHSMGVQHGWGQGTSSGGGWGAEDWVQELRWRSAEPSAVELAATPIAVAPGSPLGPPAQALPARASCSTPSKGRHHPSSTRDKVHRMSGSRASSSISLVDSHGSLFGQARAPLPAPAATRSGGSSASRGGGDDLAFDEMWAGKRSAWDMAALTRGLVPSTSSSPAASCSGWPHTGSEPTGLMPPVPPAQSPSRSLDGDTRAASCGAVRLDADRRVRPTPCQPGQRAGAARREGPVAAPLLGTSPDSGSVDLWLPNEDGTHAAMAEGGAHILMHSLHSRAWYKAAEQDWSPAILGTLPAHVLQDMRDVVASILTLEGAAAVPGPTPLIQSYNLHTSEACLAPVDTCGDVGGKNHGSSRPGVTTLAHQRHGRATSGVAYAMRALKRAALAPVAAYEAVAVKARQRHTPGDLRSHLPGNITEESAPSGPALVARQAGVASHSVQLQARAVAETPQRFADFGGCVKTQLQWLPLQWTFLAKGLPPPPAAVVMRDQHPVLTGVLLVRLLRTTVAATKAQRPQVVLQLDHLDGRPEVRRTGVRQRWAKDAQAESLRHGIVEWDLAFSFCVDLKLDQDHRPVIAGHRCLQVDLLEVPTSLSERMRVFWAPSAPDRGPVPADDATREVTLHGTARVPLEQLVQVANKPKQAVWQLLTAVPGLERDEAVGQVCLETSWLPACAGMA